MKSAYFWYIDVISYAILLLWSWRHSIKRSDNTTHPNFRFGNDAIFSIEVTLLSMKLPFFGNYINFKKKWRHYSRNFSFLVLASFQRSFQPIRTLQFLIIILDKKKSLFEKFLIKILMNVLEILYQKKKFRVISLLMKYK